MREPRRVRRVPRLRFGLSLVLSAAFGLVACTGEEPPEPPQEPPAAEEEPASPTGADIVVVLPPRTAMADEVAAAIAGDLEGLQDTAGAEIRGVRTVVPDESVFVRDLAELAAREGADLLCILGSIGRQTVTELRELHRTTRFCSVTLGDPPEEPEEGIDAVAVQIVELGHLLGAAAAELAGDGEVALALGSTELERGRFLDGMTAALGPTPLLELDEELPPDEAVTAAVADGASVVVVGTGPDADVQLEAALAAGAEVIAHAALVGSGDEVALTWNLRWDLVLGPSVDRLFGRDALSELELGLADDVFEVVLGPAATAGLAVLLDEVEEDLLRGGRDPFVVVEPEEPEEAEEPEGAEEAEAVPGGEEPEDEDGGEDPSGEQP